MVSDLSLVPCLCRAAKHEISSLRAGCTAFWAFVLGFSFSPMKRMAVAPCNRSKASSGKRNANAHADSVQEVNPTLADEVSAEQTIAVGCSLARAALGETLL